MSLRLLNYVETGYCEDLPPGPDGLKKLAWIHRLESAREGIDPFPKLDKIEVHPLYDDVDEFVESFRDHRDKSMLNRRLQVRLQPIPHEHPQPANHTRFVCISDTEVYHRYMKHKLPPGDVLLHCGNFTEFGREEEVEDFNDWLGELPYKHKIVICGKNEVSFDQEMVAKARESLEKELWYRFENIAKNPKEKTDNWAKVMTNCVLLEDAEVSVNGIRIYGSPWNPYQGGWAFNLPRGQELLDKWNKIPVGIDILMTHTPPAGQLDIVKHPERHDKRVGCVELMNTVQLRVNPLYHVFGHVHESYGFNTDAWHHFINCSILNKDQLPYNKAIIIDFPNKPDFKEGISEITQY